METNNQLGQPSTQQTFDPATMSAGVNPVGLGDAMVKAIGDLRPELFHLYDSLSYESMKDMPSDQLFDLSMKGIGPTQLIDMHQKSTAPPMLDPFRSGFNNPPNQNPLAPPAPKPAGQYTPPDQNALPGDPYARNTPEGEITDEQVAQIAAENGIDVASLDLTQWNEIKQQILAQMNNAPELAQSSPLQAPNPLQLALGAVASAFAPAQAANIMSAVFGYNIDQKRQEDERNFRVWQIENQLHTEKLKMLAALGDEEMKATIAKYEMEGRILTEKQKTKLMEDKQKKLVRDSLGRELKNAPNLSSVIGSIEAAYNEGYIDEADAKNKVIGKAQQDWSVLTSMFVKKLGFVPEATKAQFEQAAQNLLALGAGWGLKRSDLTNPTFEEDLIRKFKKASLDQLNLKNEWFPLLSADAILTHAAQRELWANLIDSRIKTGELREDTLTLDENKFYLDQWEAANKALGGGKSIDMSKLTGALKGTTNALAVAKKRKYVPGTSQITKEYQSLLPSQQKAIDAKIMKAEEEYAKAKGNYDAAQEEMNNRVNPALKAFTLGNPFGGGMPPMGTGMQIPGMNGMSLNRSTPMAPNPLASATKPFKLGTPKVSYTKDSKGNIVRR